MQPKKYQTPHDEMIATEEIMTNRLKIYEQLKMYGLLSEASPVIMLEKQML